MSSDEFDLDKFKALAKLGDRYNKQLTRLHNNQKATGAIEQAVNDAVANLNGSALSSLVIYGEPQSGKTEMMICLTARLLDDGHAVLVHLMNDSVDLLTQNLRRFKESGLAPAPKTYAELPKGTGGLPTELVVFCKKNARDLNKLITLLKDSQVGPIVVIDDEADYATPNGRVNKGEVTRINELVGQLLADDGFYVGVTATPARLDLNNTFDNDTERWVQFHSHDDYTGQDVFFPLRLDDIGYRLKLIDPTDSALETCAALVRFLVTVGYLNTYKFQPERNWTMLVHTSGKRIDHKNDQEIIESFVSSLMNPNSAEFEKIVAWVHRVAKQLYPTEDPNSITAYVVQNASRANPVVLNSERDRKALGDSATDPTSPFTIIIGGNIVSRGVTFPNLLSMYFTRDVKAKLQQDTYIQRARMFGARGDYLEHFELSIPVSLYADWRRCFVFHKLALKTISNQMGAPVWLGDSRISVASSASIDRSTVQLDKGEMAFQPFDYSPTFDDIIRMDPTSPETLVDLQSKVGADALPQFLIDYIRTVLPFGPGSLAIHESSSIEGYKDADGLDKDLIVRKKGFMGKPQLERGKFQNAVHHIKIFHNATGKARVFYKFTEGVQFIQNQV